MLLNDHKYADPHGGAILMQTCSVNNSNSGLTVLFIRCIVRI